jgi:hypothetical protein
VWIKRFRLGQIGDAQHRLGDRGRRADEANKHQRGGEEAARARERETGHDDSPVASES